jgi:hypothetical protein
MNTVGSAIYARLSGGTALTALLAGTASIYDGVVRRDASYDVVVFQLSGGGDANATPRRRKELLYSVKAISATGARAAGAIDAQIDTLLHEQTLTITGWENYWLAREGDFAYAETTPEGLNYWHAGGTYRLILCAP